MNYDKTYYEEGCKMWHLYVLLLEDGFYYIGIALDVNKRIEEHFIGIGASFTKLHKPVSVVESYCLNAYDRSYCYKLETIKTREYRDKYGTNKVIGGKYLQLRERRVLKDGSVGLVRIKHADNQ